MDSSEPLPRWSPREAFTVSAWLALLFVWTLAPLAGYDFWFYLTVGRDIVENGQLPQRESYLGTTKVFGFNDFGDTAWLGNLLCYALYSTLGPLGLVLLKSSLLTAATALVYVANRLSGLSPFWAGAWSTLALWTIRGRFEMRLYLLTTVGLAAVCLVLVLLEKKRQVPCWTLAAIGGLFVLWTNLHQGVIAGYIVLGGWLILGKAPWRQRLLLFTAAFAGGLIRPNLSSLPALYGQLLSNSSPFQGIVEWGAPSMEHRFIHLGLFFLVLGWLAVQAAIRLQNKGLEQRPAFLLIALAFATMAWHSHRSIAELLPVVCPLTACLFPPLSERRRPQIAVALILCLLLWTSGDLDRLRDIQQIKGQPERLAQRLEPAGQVFNSFEFGNFLTFQRIPPFIHGMHAFYNQQLVIDFEAVLNPTPRRTEILQRFEVASALLHHPTDEDATLNLVETLADSPDWRLLAWDDTGLLFGKGPKETGLTRVKPWKEPPWDDPSLAEAELRTLLQHYPSALGYLYLSRLLLDRGDINQALTEARKATQLGPHFALAWTHLGACYARSGNLAGVLTASKEAVKLAPQNEVPHRNLALALSQAARLQGGLGGSWNRLRARFHAWQAYRLAKKRQAERN